MLSKIFHFKILGFASYFLHLEYSKISHGASKAVLLKVFNKNQPTISKTEVSKM